MINPIKSKYCTTCGDLLHTRAGGGYVTHTCYQCGSVEKYSLLRYSWSHRLDRATERGGGISIRRRPVDTRDARSLIRRTPDAEHELEIARVLAEADRLQAELDSRPRTPRGDYAWMTPRTTRQPRCAERTVTDRRVRE